MISYHVEVDCAIIRSIFDLIVTTDSGIIFLLSCMFVLFSKKQENNKEWCGSLSCICDCRIRMLGFLSIAQYEHAAA